jgi:DNA-binding IclR family transcriptional regulator
MKKSSLQIDESKVLEARLALCRRSETESWSEIARSVGLPKSTVYHFAKRDYLPKNPKALARLIGRRAYDVGTIVVRVRRDGSGRFAKE